jgi:hypothetical protein
MANYVLLERTELNASVASITFANIPQSGYTDLKVVISARGDGASGSFICQFNGATTGLSSRVLYGINGNATGSSSYSDENSIWGYTTNSGSTSNTFNNAEIYIPNYNVSGVNKPVSIDAVNETNAADARQNMTAGLWSSTAAITSITLLSKTGSNVATNFTQYSTFSLYGLAATGTTPVIAPKASGGNVIDTDGTYWIHTFNTSGTFTPSTSLTCDYLVVAGGGGGAGSGGGAGPGGGGGGFRTGTGLAVTAQNYTITVGGGGTATGLYGTTNGSNSVFSSITSTGGGTGGDAGGSGGGGYPNSSGAAGTSGQGNAGGSGSGAGGNRYTGGGGGGAGAVGGNASSSAGGNGGNGTANSYSGTSVTYAGGGGGGGGRDGGRPESLTGGTGGTGGGGAGGSTSSPSGSVNGTVNTGGGGGGAGYDGNPVRGALGGSGIVIIRYPV